MARQRTYTLDSEALRERIDRYFAELEEDPGRRGGPCDLLARLGLDLETARRLTCAPGDAYRRHALLLRQAATRLRGHLETAPAWSGGNSSKSVFLLKQQFWDGSACADKQEGGGDVDATVRVLFGGTDAGQAFD